MKNIAIVGTEGSGKTVFVTVLANYFSSVGTRGVFFDPIGGPTIRFVENSWNQLQSGQWPDQTISGESFEYLWHCRFDSGGTFQLKVIDSAGQDLRRIFSDTPPPQLRQLADYVHSAPIVLFLLNLGDFIGVVDQRQVTENVVALKSALDRLKGDGRKSALLLTQTDLYEHLFNRHRSWLEVVRNTEPLKLIYNAYLYNDSIPLFAVASVADTVIESLPNGSLRRMPAPDFKCMGMNEFGQWLVEAAKQVKKLEPPSDPPVLPPQPPIPKPVSRRKWIPWAAAGGIGFLLLRGCVPSFIACSDCNGTGKTGIFFKTTCERCHGSGKIKE